MTSTDEAINSIIKSLPPDEEILCAIKIIGDKIDRIQNDMLKTNLERNEVVDKLENYKKYLRETAAGLQGGIKWEDIKHDLGTTCDEEAYLLGSLKQVKSTLSITDLETMYDRVDFQISKAEYDCNEKNFVYDELKVKCEYDLNGLTQVDIFKNALVIKIKEIYDEYINDMELLQMEKEALEKSNTDENDKAMSQELVNNQILNRQQEYEELMLSMREQAQAINQDYEEHRHNLLDGSTGSYELNVQFYDKSLATSNDRSLIDEGDEILVLKNKIAMLQEQKMRSQDKSIDKELKTLKAKLRKLRLNNVFAKLRSKGITVGGENIFLTDAGQILTKNEAQAQGYFSEIQPTELAFLVDHLRQQECSDDSTETVSSSASGMSPEDVNYLKNAIGKPLILALKEITMKQPRDPIHYLAHWLMKYRYNQEIEQSRKTELDDLNKEQERIAKETLHRIIVEEAQAAILAIISRAEQIALENEILRRLEEEEMLENEEGEEYIENI